MQPIERYALVTLLFLVVLVMVVALWDDGSTAQAAGEDQTVARVDETERPRTETPRSPAGGQRGDTQITPLSGLDDPAATANRRMTRNVREAKGPSEAMAGGPAASTPRPNGDTQGMMKPERTSNGPTTASMQDAFRAATSGPGAVAGDRGAGQDATLNAGVTNSRLRSGGSRTLERGPDSTRRRDPQQATGRPTTPRAGSATGSNTSPRTRSNDGPRTETTRTTPKPATPKAGTRDYVVRSGDTLERIARRELDNERAVGAIARLNGLIAPYTIYEGKTIKLPARADVAPSGASAKPPTAAPGGGRTVYTFRSGEVLSVVLVEKFGTYKRSIGLVKELNPGINVDRIIAGDKIVLPRADEIPGGVVKTASTKPKPQPAASRTRAAVDPNNEFVVR